MLGEPIIRGALIRLELILRKLGEDVTHGDLPEPDPHPTEDDIQAAIMWAADSPAHEERVLVEPRARMRFLTVPRN